MSSITEPLTATSGSTFAPVAEDMSAYVIAGAVTSEQQRSQWETVSRTPAQGIDDGVEAERLGFRRVWLSERIDIKNADVILSGIGARTSRIELGTGVIDPTTRHVWLTAALGATMHACYGPRFVLGLGRGDDGYFRGTGIRMASSARSSGCRSPRRTTARTRSSGLPGSPWPRAPG
jgi:hypothetical protein